MRAKNGKGNAIVKLLVVLVVVAAAGWFAFNRFRTVAIVDTVKRGAAVDIVNGSVVVHAEGELRELKSEADGRVAWCEPLVTGRTFAQGAELMKLDSTDLERTIKQENETHAAAVERRNIQLRDDPRLKVAQRTFDEAKRQHDRNEIADVDFETAQRTFDAAKRAIELEDFDFRQSEIKFKNDQADRQLLLERMTAHAPIDGIVQSVNVYVGALISKNATVATYYSNKREVVAKVSEDSAGKLAVGQRAKIRLTNYGSKEFDATVTKVLPFADTDTRYTAYLEIDPKVLAPEKLIPSGTGEVTITVAENANSPIVDRRALFSGIEGYYVFVVKDGRVEKRKVETGFIGLNKAEIKKFLEPGELVIVSDLEQFRSGQSVRTVSVN